jgi:hypothetical protein
MTSFPTNTAEIIAAMLLMFLSAYAAYVLSRWLRNCGYGKQLDAISIWMIESRTRFVAFLVVTVLRGRKQNQNIINDKEH